MIVPFELSQEKQHPCTRITAFSPTFFQCAQRRSEAAIFKGKTAINFI